MSDGSRTLFYKNDDGKDVECEILFTYHSDEFNKNYVLFFEKGSDDGDSVEIMAASYDEADETMGTLSPIESDEEWAMLDEVLEEFQEDIDSADDEE
jgi:uncharacterized protein YrzB (UPF0473 family)